MQGIIQTCVRENENLLCRHADVTIAECFAVSEALIATLPLGWNLHTKKRSGASSTDRIGRPLDVPERACVNIGVCTLLDVPKVSIILECWVH